MAFGLRAQAFSDNQAIPYSTVELASLVTMAVLFIELIIELTEGGMLLISHFLTLFLFINKSKTDRVC
ncbi:hypothetical protein N9B68_00395 [bacterium]|nr:hypothetical protein [bacterium]MDB4480842.1 hypothetical protein [bacterium]